MEHVKKFLAQDLETQKKLVDLAIDEFFMLSNGSYLDEIIEQFDADYVKDYLSFQFFAELTKAKEGVTIANIALSASRDGFIGFCQKINSGECDKEYAKLLAENFADTLAIELEN